MPSKKSKSEPRSGGASTFKKTKQGGNLKLLCRYCHAVYNGKNWTSFEKMNPAIIDELRASVCPACHEIKDHVSDGVLHITGASVRPHLPEIKGLIAHMGKQAEEKNILDRVERIDAGRDGIVVYTTMNQLAVRIGKSISNAFKGGKLDIKWSREDKPVEVRWTYDKVKK